MSCAARRAKALPAYPVWIAFALLATLLLALFLHVGQANAAPGAYRVLIAEAYPDGAKKLQAQVAAFPDVATVDLANTGEDEGATPTAAQLSGYDAVVSIGDSSYLDRVAWGNSLAEYVDSGGVVIQTTYDTWDGGGAPSGRFESGGYAPLIPGPNDNIETSLGSFNASSPLMQGVVPGSLTTGDNTTNELAAGASLIASWADDRVAVASKGRVVAITAYIGDSNGEVWSGDYGRIVVNAVRTYGRQVLTVVNSKPERGTVQSSTGGISCGAVCSANFVFQAPVSLTAKAKKGFAFAGFAGSCTGVTCSLSMDAAKSVTASFASFKFGKVKLDEDNGTARLSVRVGAPGKLVVSGAGVKKGSRSTKKAGKVTLPIRPKGSSVGALRGKGRARVKFKLAFTPTGGSTSTLTKSVQLRLGS